MNAIDIQYVCELSSRRSEVVAGRKVASGNGGQSGLYSRLAWLQIIVCSLKDEVHTMHSGLEHLRVAGFVASMCLAKELARDQLRSAHWACVSVCVHSLARSRMCMNCGTIDVQGMSKGCARVALDVHGGCAEGSELLRDAQDMRTATNTVGL